MKYLLKTELNTTTQYLPPNRMKSCKVCGTTDQSAFYTTTRNMKCRTCMIETSILKQRQGQDIQNAEKMKRGECLVCKLKVTPDTTYRFDFDHRDPTLKREQVSHLTSCNEKIIQDEMLKCDLLCAICHRDKTYNPTSPYASLPTLPTYACVGRSSVLPG